MASKGRNPHADALAVLQARIASLSTRLDHAKLARDSKRIESLTKKLARAMAKASRLRRKLR